MDIIILAHINGFLLGIITMELIVPIIRQRREFKKLKKVSCDHKYSNGEMAGPKFDGSSCGFICEICRCSVSYERMGYYK